MEQVIGQQAVVQAFRSEVGRDATWEDLLAAVEAGEPAGEQLRDRCQATLGWLTAALAWTLDPDLIVYGGPASALLQSDTTALHRSLRDNGPAGITNAWRLSGSARAVPASGRSYSVCARTSPSPHSFNPPAQRAAWRLPPNTGAPGGIRTPNLLIRSQMLYPLSHGCGRLMRCLAAEQHRESVSAQTAPTNREPCSGQSQLSCAHAAVQADFAEQSRRGDPVAHEVNAVSSIDRRSVAP